LKADRFHGFGWQKGSGHLNHGGQYAPGGQGSGLRQYMSQQHAAMGHGTSGSGLE
jgi:hypothetical protein